MTACIGGVALSKLLFIAWGLGLPELDYTGLSGRRALDALVWLTVAARLARRGGLTVRTMANGVGVMLALGIAYSRIVLNARSVSEVLLECVFGLAIAGWLLLPRPVA